MKCPDLFSLKNKKKHKKQKKQTNKKKIVICYSCDWRLKGYSKCPKISNAKVSDKMTYANSADPDQTAPEGAVWSGSTLFAIPLSILETAA